MVFSFQIPLWSCQPPCLAAMADASHLHAKCSFCWVALSPGSPITPMHPHFQDRGGPDTSWVVCIFSRPLPCQFFSNNSCPKEESYQLLVPLRECPGPRSGCLTPQHPNLCTGKGWS